MLDFTLRLASETQQTTDRASRAASSSEVTLITLAVVPEPATAVLPAAGIGAPALPERAERRQKACIGAAVLARSLGPMRDRRSVATASSRSTGLLLFS